MKVSVLLPAPMQAQVLDRWREANPAGPREILVCGRAEGDPPSLPRLRWVEAGPDQALQRGLEAATGEVLLLMAGDTAPGPGLVEAHRAFHQVHAAPLRPQGRGEVVDGACTTRRRTLTRVAAG